LGAVIAAVVAAEFHRDVTETALVVAPTRHDHVPYVPPSATADMDTPWHARVTRAEYFAAARERKR